ncbi:hypothetical protein ALC60_13018 [Trachymyrmex zeteki]|uniref:Uncharacterized protein n=1 Tax=Mycetomoellerius zeteki TaxID=64791 RepID=A0A151WJM7_9HYME|nr:hypothetical protein ALC60_13018 [Trachymyrmex zeteki]
MTTHHTCSQCPPSAAKCSIVLPSSLVSLTNFATSSVLTRVLLDMTQLSVTSFLFCSSSHSLILANKLSITDDNRSLSPRLQAVHNLILASDNTSFGRFGLFLGFALSMCGREFRCCFSGVDCAGVLTLSLSCGLLLLPALELYSVATSPSGNGSGLILKLFLSKGGFLPPKSTIRLCGPTARYKIAAELLMCIDHDSNISCTC